MVFQLRNNLLATAIVMLTMGTAWAIRGSFGHEYGAAWAGAVGVLSLLVVSGREDWLRNWPAITAMGAIGWGMTGMISYGQVVGYGKSTDFLNVSYGLLSLFLIGGLFGFLGGGLTGVMLERSRTRKPDWAALVTQMVAGGYILWGYLIYQLEWYMTPPRSELWAACLGAALALGWFMKRHNLKNAWYLALSTMLGAGFGFAFGNFVQVLGNTTGIAFNWWNVMEYAIGFFGGLGMAYGLFHRSWPTMALLSKKTHYWAGAFVFLLVPLVTITSSFSYDKISGLGEQLSIANPMQFYVDQWLMVTGISLAAVGTIAVQFRTLRAGTDIRKKVLMAFFTTWIWYKLLQLILAGTLYEYHFSSDDFAILNIVTVAVGWTFLKGNVPVHHAVGNRTFNAKLIRISVGIVLLLLALSGIAMNIHGELPGEQQRFDVKTETVK
ncbi:hypothetical protein [Fodinibius sediminis]|uniref:Uncharacterized protein n=1 Tax=Fodinibius sediminis TaxID=1214077 RepID=A0A521BTR1_9BACT|nr:hypothetical protein [Fodinibius sediminis]SMO50574.1 hypothetical protein SAMN06265218_10417 [Fodinibius sediminis]